MSRLRARAREWMGRYHTLHREHREAERVRRLHRLEQEFLPPLLEIQETPPSPRKRQVLWSLLLLLLLALVWGWFGRINVVATAAGRFMPDGRTKVVEPLQLGAVTAIRVEVGQRVRAGEVLVELDTTPQLAGLEAIERAVSLNVSRRGRLDAALAGQAPMPAGDGEAENLQHDIWQAELDAYHSQRRTKEAGVAEARAELAAAEALLERSRQTLALAAEQAQSAGVLAGLGAIPRNEYLRLERERLAQAGEHESRRQRVEQLTARLVGAQQALERLDAERRLRLLGQLEETLSQSFGLEENRRKVEHGINSHHLRAPVDGTVQSVNLTSLGEVVAPGQEVVTIVPEEVPLVVEVQVSNRDAGFVEVGQPVEIKVDAFPFMQYGVIPGRLVSLSPDVEEGAQGQTYRAWVEPERTVLRYQGREVGVRPGMTVAVDVNTGERRIIEFFLSPLIKNLKEGLSVR